ncbi:MAG: hypothetical protein RIS17_907, partial [Pseudomonadota bacterium]
MRIASAALAALLLAAPALAAEQTAAELIERNRAARGGAAALGALKSVRLEGKLIFPGGFELTYNEVRSGGAVRVEAALQGLTLTTAYDGKGGAWRINPFEGRKDAERMTDDEARSLADSASIAGVLLSAAGEGAAVTYLGREDFDGTDCYKLKVAQKDGDEFVYLIDPDSMLEVKVIETRSIRGAVQVNETELGDYEAVGGVMIPMSIESGPQGSSQ